MSNDPAFNIRFYLIETALLLAPFFAYFGSKVNSWLRPRQSVYLVALSVLLIGAAIFFNFSDWSLRGDIANLLVGDLGYLAAFYILFTLASLVRPKGLRWVLRATFLIPILLGLALGSVGVLGLMFIIGDSTPRQEAKLNSHYGYQVCFTGGAYTSGDTAEVDIVRYPSFLPIQKTVWHRSFDEREYDYYQGLRVALSPDGRQVLVTVTKYGGAQEVEHFEVR